LSGEEKNFKNPVEEYKGFSKVKHMKVRKMGNNLIYLNSNALDQSKMLLHRLLIYLKRYLVKRTGGMAQVVEHLSEEMLGEINVMGWGGTNGQIGMFHYYSKDYTQTDFKYSEDCLLLF
jgi:hypothetical protein